MKTDYHCHSNYSQDCRETPEQLIAAAETLQLDILAITDHADFAAGDSCFEPDSYLRHLKSLAAASHRVQVICGVELGIQAEHAELCRSFTAGREFDFIIGSMHRALELDFYAGEFYQRFTTISECWRVYLEESLKAVRAFSDFDVFGHIDIIRRYNITRQTMIPDESKPQLDQLLEWLIANGKGIEINTSGFRYGLDSVHPHTALLKRYRELGGEIVTIGSDSHSTSTIAQNFDHATDLLKSTGFTHFTWYKNRQPHFAEL